MSALTKEANNHIHGTLTTTVVAVTDALRRFYSGNPWQHAQPREMDTSISEMIIVLPSFPLSRSCGFCLWPRTHPVPKPIPDTRPKFHRKIPPAGHTWQCPTPNWLLQTLPRAHVISSTPVPAVAQRTLPLMYSSFLRHSSISNALRNDFN